MRSSDIKAFFVTGTDTGIGKTTVIKLLIQEFNKQGLVTIGCKPVASCEQQEEVSADAQSFLEVNAISLPLSTINPISLGLPVSPNIAAKCLDKPISLKVLLQRLKALYELPVDAIFFEGIGGWEVPINDEHTMADVAAALAIPVILVVGIRVGCINHAILTSQSIIKRSPVLGWIANVFTADTPLINEHIMTLNQYLPLPFLGTLGHHQLDVSVSIDMEKLLMWQPSYHSDK